MQSYEELAEYYRSLAPHPPHPLAFNHHSLRHHDHQRCLERPFFAIAALLAIEAGRTATSFTLMVTASHNPPDYNGLKLEAISSEALLDKARVNGAINSDALALQAAREAGQMEKSEGVFYLGRDKRPSSPGLAAIIKKVLEALGKGVIDLGERTTPEVFSLSQFLHRRAKEGEPITVLIPSFFTSVESCFSGAVREICANRGKEWERKRVCLDLANGVGGESLRQYGFIEKYLDIAVVNDADFSHPNVKCGAEWICSHYDETDSLPDLQLYPNAQEYYFFDGDSDRIIGRMGQEERPTDGDDFNACFARLLKDLFASMGKEQEIVAVGTITSNAGVARYLQSIGVGFERVPVGIGEVVCAVRKYPVGCYFESSGHGALHFSQPVLAALQEEECWQAQVLLHLHGLSLNSSRGYALHNMLIMQLYLLYFSAHSALLFPKDHLLNKEIPLAHPEAFSNSPSGRKLLEEPAALVGKLKQLEQEWGSEILLRKSSTIAALRVTVQGERSKCEAICVLLEKELKKYDY